MSRRLALLTLGFCAVVVLAAAGTGCGPQRMAADELAQLSPPARLLTLESAGPGADGAVAAAQALLADDSLVCRAQAAQLLGAWAATGHASLALPALTHSDGLIRGIAQASYTEHSGYGLAPLVVEGNVVEVPPATLEALAELQDPQGLVDVNAAIMEHQAALRRNLDGPAETAVLAADLLARAGDAGARRRLIRLVEEAKGPVLAKAARACVRDGMGLGPTLLPLAFKGDVEARQAVMQALVVSPDPRLKHLPIQGLQDDDLAVRRNAIRALGNLGGAAPIDELAAKLEGTDAEKADAIRALGVVGKPAADVLRAYIETTKDADWFQVSALLALAPNANRDDIGWISTRLTSPSTSMRAGAAVALGRIGHPAAQAALVAALKDVEPLVRASVAKALGQIGTIYAAKQLLPMLKDPSPLVAAMAAWGLGATAYPEAVPALKQVAEASSHGEAASPRVGDMFGWPELSAAEALGRIRSAAAVASLREILKSSSWLMRATAAQALGASGEASPEVTADLEKLLDDPINLVRAQALLSLKTLGKTYEPGAFQTR